MTENNKEKKVETTLVGGLLWLSSILTCFYAPMAYIAGLFDRNLIINGMKLPKVELPELIGIILFSGVIYIISKLLDMLIFEMRKSNNKSSNTNQDQL